jgi:hypothetical protein
VLVLLIDGFMEYAVEMYFCGMIYILSFMNIIIGVQAILRGFL